MPIVKSIIKKGKTEQKCITLDNDEGLYILKNGIVTHNSLFTVLSNLYISTCTSLMWAPYKYFGQSQPLDCKVYTKDGYKLIGDIKVGDKVITPNNDEAEVIQLHPQGKIPTYEIELDDGRKTRCSAQHLWKVSYRLDSNNEKIWEIVNTQFMIDNPNIDFEIPDYVNGTQVFCD